MRLFDLSQRILCVNDQNEDVSELTVVYHTAIVQQKGGEEIIIIVAKILLR